jgi:predicted flap endonuclease-1-like 5' DNA nuclease
MSIFSTLSCCWFWLLAGILLGWLLNWFLRGCKCKSTNQVTQTYVPPTPAPTPVAKVPDAPAPVAKVMSETPKAEAPKSPTIDLAAAKAAGISIKNVDDLTVIEGIGPKINELFKNAGLKTFAQVAVASVPQMRKILDDGGSRFRIANPETWAQQAALAAANKWTELKKLQDELSGGLKK